MSILDVKKKKEEGSGGRGAVVVVAQGLGRGGGRRPGTLAGTLAGTWEGQDVGPASGRAGVVLTLGHDMHVHGQPTNGVRDPDFRELGKNAKRRAP